MKIFRVIMLCLACTGWLFATAASNDAEQTQKMILKEFDIDAKFMKSSHYNDIKKSIKDSKRKRIRETSKLYFKTSKIIRRFE